MRYEYKVEWVRGTQTRKDKDHFEDRLQDKLSSMADKGWRMVNIDYCADGAELIFERQDESYRRAIDAPPATYPEVIGPLFDPRPIEAKS